MKSLPKSLLLYPIGVYRRWLSPFLPPHCRYYPTCSEYAVQAVSTHGAARGTRLALWRLLRCNPFSPGGFDPVPRIVRPSVPASAHPLRTTDAPADADDASEAKR